MISLTSASPTVRAWILAVALVSFGAGAVAGLVLPELLAAERELDIARDDADFLSSKYGLTAEQRRLLVMVFEEHHRIDLNILRDAETDEYSEALRNKRLLHSRKTDDRVRFVLDEQQRALYDRDKTIPKLGASSSSSVKENR